MKRVLKPFVVWIALGVIVGLCPAPITDPRPNPPPVPEQSQAQLEQQQQFNGAHGEVGRVVIKEETTRIDQSGPDYRGAADLMRAEKAKQEEQAKEDLKVAEQTISGKKPVPVKSFVLGLVVLILAVACVLGLRMWADKNIPEPVTTPSKPKW